MKPLKVILVTVILSACSALHAQSQAPAGATGQCKDGTYSNAKSKSGACAGHKGVQAWYASAAAPTTAAPTTAASTPQAASPAPAPAARQSSAPAPSQPAAGGGTGQVWVNTKTKVYHCPGDRYYGKP